MLSESLRQRIESLNRQTLPKVAPRVAPSVGLASAAQQTPARRAGQPLTGLLNEGSVVANAAGEHLRIRLPIESLWGGGNELVAGRLKHLQALPADKHNAALSPLMDALPGRAAMLDLETCGLSGSALFLVGLIVPVDEVLTVELLFARSYAEEKAVLVSLWERLAGCDAVATFNGKSFDWPMVMDRSRRHLLHKQQRLVGPEHFDLLHTSRRRWRGRLPDCKLQTIERLVCRRSRTGDIPGSKIPAAYDAFVRTGDPIEMDAVLYHNALDLITLLDITLRLAA